jgi:NADH:ubiquinone oxidoreductase subunit 2 (subunit N)
MVALLPLLPLVALVTGLWAPPPAAAALVAALAIALLTRSRDDVLHSECALKLMWVLGPALAVSFAGVALLAIATGTSVLGEQWAVLAVPLEPTMLWQTSLSMSLLLGFVLLGGAPFHFWAADVMQGARPWVSALAVSALQVSGGAWLAWRLDGVEALPEAANITGSLLGLGAGVAFAVGAITLPFQRRPERRVGTLASLNGALLLAGLAVRHGGGAGASPALFETSLWSAHLALALAGAATLAPFLPVTVRSPAPGSVLFRRHPAWGALGLYSLASLAGVPGTPGALVWFGVARTLVAGSRTGLLLLLALAWVTAFAIAVRQVREAYGVWSQAPMPPRPVPAPARWAMLFGVAGLVALAVGLRG